MTQSDQLQACRDMFLEGTACLIGSTYNQHIQNFSDHIHLGISIILDISQAPSSLTSMEQ